MKDIDIPKVVSQVRTFIGTENAQGKGKYGPEVDNLIVSPVMVRQLMDLGMAVVAAGYTVGGSSCLYLLVLDSAVFKSLFLEA